LQTREITMKQHKLPNPQRPNQSH